MKWNAYFLNGNTRNNSNKSIRNSYNHQSNRTKSKRLPCLFHLCFISFGSEEFICNIERCSNHDHWHNELEENCLDESQNSNKCQWGGNNGSFRTFSAKTDILTTDEVSCKSIRNKSKNGNKSKEKSFHKGELQYIEIQICHKFDDTISKSSNYETNNSINNHISCFLDFFILTDREYHLDWCPSNSHNTKNTRKRYKKCNDICDCITWCHIECRKDISWCNNIAQRIHRKYRREK